MRSKTSKRQLNFFSARFFLRCSFINDRRAKEEDNERHSLYHLTFVSPPADPNGNSKLQMLFQLTDADLSDIGSSLDLSDSMRDSTHTAFRSGL